MTDQATAPAAKRTRRTTSRLRPLKLRPPRSRKAEQAPGGAMTLVEHLRELRGRLIKGLLATVPGFVLGLVFYDPISKFLVEPVCDVEVRTIASQGGCGPLIQNTLTGPINTTLSIAVATGLFVAAPVWLYQLWAFITPGLHTHERRWSVIFLATAVPLFFAGAFVCYLIIPKAVEVLLGFTIEGAANTVNASDYFNILLRLVLVFGLAFELPVFIAMLNAAGVLTAAKLRSWWRGVVMGVFVFSAVATPTGDPFTMLALAAPMLVLAVLAYFFCVWNDRRRARATDDFSGLDDDEVSPLDTRPSTLD